MIDVLYACIAQFVPVGPAEKEIIARLWREKRFRKGEHFLQEGKVCRHVGFIVQGLMRYYISQDGEEKTFSFSKEGQFVSNYESFVPQKASTKSIEALEDTVAYVISYDDLKDFYANMANGERMGRMAIELVFVQTLQDLNSFYADTPEQRYARLLLAHPDLQQRIPQYYIASCVGVKPQSLSRIRKRLAMGGH